MDFLQIFGNEFTPNATVVVLHADVLQRQVVGSIADAVPTPGMSILLSSIVRKVFSRKRTNLTKKNVIIYFLQAPHKSPREGRWGEGLRRRLSCLLLSSVPGLTRSPSWTLLTNSTMSGGRVLTLPLCR